MIDKRIVHENRLVAGSQYSSDFDMLMHGYCLRRFTDRIRGKKCLELGCYHGAMTKLLAEISSQVTAVDNDLICLDRASKNCRAFKNVDFVKSDFSEYSDYGSAEVIYFSHALEHVKDDKKLLFTLFTETSPLVEVITVVPNALSLSRQIAKSMGILSDVYSVTPFEKSIGHYRTYDLESLISLYTATGFEILEAGGIMPKIFSNNQFVKALESGVIDRAYLDGLFLLSDRYPEICASVYLIARKPSE